MNKNVQAEFVAKPTKPTEPEYQRWELQFTTPQFSGTMSEDAYLFLLTHFNFESWMKVVSDYESVIEKNCPAGMFADFKIYLQNFRTKFLPNHEQIALKDDLRATDQEENLEILCKSFQHFLQNKAAISLRSECTLLIPQISRWLSVIWKVKSSLPEGLGTSIELNFHEFRHFCKNQLMKEEVHLDKVVECLTLCEKFSKDKVILQNAIRTSPLPIGSHYPAIVDLGIILSQEKRPILVHPIPNYPEKDFVLFHAIELYQLAAEYAQSKSTDLLTTLWKAVEDSLKGSMYCRHLDRIENKITIRRKKIEKFSKHCQNMIFKIRHGFVRPSRETFECALECLEEAKFKVSDLSFKLRVYILRRLTKLYNEVLNDMKSMEKKAQRKFRKLKHNRNNDRCKALLYQMGKVRRFWERLLDKILQEIHKNKSLKLIMNLHKNYLYFWNAATECRSTLNKVVCDDACPEASSNI